MKHGALISLGGATVLAAVAYLFVGRPTLPDQPYAAREAEIASRPADDLSRGEMLARLQMTASSLTAGAAILYRCALYSQGETETHYGLSSGLAPRS